MERALVSASEVFLLIKDICFTICIVILCVSSSYFGALLAISKFDKGHSILVIHQDDAEYLQQEQQAKIRGRKN